MLRMASFHKSSGHGGPTSSLSRASSTGSLYAQGGSAANTEGPTDDEDSDGKNGSYGNGGGGTPGTPSGGQGNGGAGSQSYRERRREAHTQAEQKRRDAIKKGYDYLQELVPVVGGVEGEGAEGTVAIEGTPNSPGDDMPGGANGKISKAAVLQRSIDYILHTQQQKKKQEEELSQLRKEMVALQIMQANYEQLVKGAHQGAGGDLRDGNDRAVPSDVKFEIFRNLMDTLFDSFNDRVSMREFSELSAGVFSWIEEQCKPQMLQEAMHGILENARDKYQQRHLVDQHGGGAVGGAGGNVPHDSAAAAAAAAAMQQQQQSFGFKAENASDPKI